MCSLSTLKHRQQTKYRADEFAALDAHKADITGISLSTAAGTARYIPLRHRVGTNANEPSVMSYLAGRVFNNSRMIKIAHNLSFETIVPIQARHPDPGAGI